MDSEAFTPEALKYIWSDNGGEFTGAHFRGQLQKDGIQHETSVLDTPEQNGLAEQMNQMLSTITNTMLKESKLPKSFWEDAMATAAYVTAQSPADGLKGGTPYEALFNRHVNPTCFQRFRSPAYALIPKDKQPGKLYPHAQKAIMIWYTHGQQAYKLLDLKCHTVFSNQHVQFNEEATLAPFKTNLWNTHTTGNKWEELTAAHHHVPENTYPDVDDDEPDITSKELAEAVGGNQPPPSAMQIENIEAVGDQHPCTPEAQVQPEEP